MPPRTVTMQRVTGADDMDALSELAREIWTEHYVPLIGRAQVDYMLDKFQSVRAMTAQIAEGYEYYFVRHDGQPAGYFALVPNSRDASVLLSKIYIRCEERGGGLGRAIVAFAVERCRDVGALELWLTVNRHNAGSIAFYERTGFVVAGELVTDIGNGFVMDDYRMVLRVKA